MNLSNMLLDSRTRRRLRRLPLLRRRRRSARLKQLLDRITAMLRRDRHAHNRHGQGSGRAATMGRRAMTARRPTTPTRPATPTRPVAGGRAQMPRVARARVEGAVDRLAGLRR
jgi:hypothetical protein